MTQLNKVILAQNALQVTSLIYPAYTNDTSFTQGGHAGGMLVAQMAVNLHRQCTAVTVAQPAGDGEDAHAGFNAACCEQLAQVVMGDTGNASDLGGTVHRPLAFADTHHGGGL